MTNDANAGLLTLTLAARPDQTLGEGASDPCVIGTTGLTLEKVGDNVTIVYECLEQAAVQAAGWRVLSRVEGRFCDKKFICSGQVETPPISP